MSTAYLSAMGISLHEQIPFNQIEHSPFNQIKCDKLDYATTVTVIVWPKAYGKPSHAAMQTYAGAGTNQSKKEEWRQRKVLNEACKANGFYISFYPAITQESPCNTRACKWKDHPLHSNTEGCHYHDAETDIDGNSQEGIQIYHLNVGKDNIRKINNAFKSYLKSSNVWHSLGSSYLRLPYQDNCAGLVLKLLEIGGVRNPYKSRVNTFLRTSFFAGSMGLVTAGAAAFSYRYRNALIQSDLAIESVKKSGESSRKTYRSAIAISRLVDRELTPDQQILVENTDYLMNQAIEIFTREIPEVYNSVKEGKNLVTVAAGVSIAASIVFMVGGWRLSRLLNETVTPESVARAVKVAPQWIDSPRIAASCCEGEVVLTLDEKQSGSFLRPLTIASAIFGIALTCYKTVQSSK